MVYICCGCCYCWCCCCCCVKCSRRRINNNDTVGCCRHVREEATQAIQHWLNMRKKSTHASVYRRVYTRSHIRIHEQSVQRQCAHPIIRELIIRSILYSIEIVPISLTNLTKKDLAASLVFIITLFIRNIFVYHRFPLSGSASLQPTSIFASYL